jgi:hypothetical protein
MFSSVIEAMVGVLEDSFVDRRRAYFMPLLCEMCWICFPGGPRTSVFLGGRGRGRERIVPCDFRWHVGFCNVSHVRYVGFCHVCNLHGWREASRQWCVGLEIFDERVADCRCYIALLAVTCSCCLSPLS